MSGDAAQRREALGRLVRETWVKWASEQLDAKPSWLDPWEQLDDGQREVDMRIGEAVANAEHEWLADLGDKLDESEEAKAYELSIRGEEREKIWRAAQNVAATLTRPAMGAGAGESVDVLLMAKLRMILDVAP